MNLGTKYLGLDLKTPLVASSSPLTRQLDNFKKMEDFGIGAIVLHSLFEEHTLTCRANYEFGSLIGPDAYFEQLAAAKASVSIPLIASLNCTTLGGWLGFTQQIEQAGADALELNLNPTPADPAIAGSSIEAQCLEIIGAVRKKTSLPLSVKLSSNYTNFANIASRVDALGVDGLVMFNRFYHDDIDIDSRSLKAGGIFSSSLDMRLPLHWIRILYGNVDADLAASGGMHQGRDVVKMIMAGADVTMLCSVLMDRGIYYLHTIEREMAEWLEKHDCDSLEDVRGVMSLKYCPDAGAMKRAQYLKAMSSLVPPAGQACVTVK